MSRAIHKDQEPHSSNGAPSSQNAMSMADRLDSLTVLVHAMLGEIESLKGNRENVVPIVISAELSRFEAGLIRSALLHTGGRQRQAARLLGMKVSTLHRKVKLYKLRSPSERSLEGSR